MLLRSKVNQNRIFAWPGMHHTCEQIEAVCLCYICTCYIYTWSFQKIVSCRYLVESARGLGLEVIDRCNLTVLLEPGQETLAQFLADNQVGSRAFAADHTICMDHHNTSSTSYTTSPAYIASSMSPCADLCTSKVQLAYLMNALQPA